MCSFIIAVVAVIYYKELPRSVISYIHIYLHLLYLTYSLTVRLLVYSLSFVADTMKCMMEV